MSEFQRGLECAAQYHENIAAAADREYAEARVSGTEFMSNANDAARIHRRYAESIRQLATKEGIAGDE